MIQLPVLALLAFSTPAAWATANYVYHERTTTDPGCGGQYVTTLNPTSAQSYDLRYKIEYQFYTDTTVVYYTTNGSAPSGALGVPSGTTAVVAGSYTCSFGGGPVVDVASATIPAQPAGTVVKYIISAWHTGGGPEIFANSGEFSSPFTTSGQATVFQYTVGSTSNLYWDKNGNTAGAGGTTPTGTWGTDGFWSTVIDGTAATGSWTSGRNAIFAAGTDATGTYTVTVSGTQTAGSLTIEEGEVAFATGAVSVGAGNVTINPGATLSTDSNLRLASTAGSTMTINGGTVKTTNPSNAGTFVDTDFTVTLGAAGGTFSHVTTNILSIAQDASAPTVVRVTGPGGLTKTGIGVLAIACATDYQGPTIINDGELRMRTTANRLPTNTAVTINSVGILNLNGVSTTIGSLAGSGRVGFSGATLFINGTSDTVFSGTLTNQANYGASGAASSAGRVSKSGSGSLTLTGTNLITGSITNFAGSINVAPGAILCDRTCDIYVHGGFLNLSNAAQSILSLRGTNNGTVSLAPGHLLTIGGNSTHTFQGSITGAGAIERTNATGAWILTGGPSSYTGQTFIRAGIIQASHPTALGATNGNTEISSGGEVRFDGATVNFTNAEPFRIAGGGSGGGGAITIQSSAAPTLTGPIILTANSWITVSSSASGTLAGDITALSDQSLFLAGGANASGIKLISGDINLGAGGITKTNSGEWILSGSNTYSGPTAVVQGTLKVANPTGSATGVGTVTVSSGASLIGDGTIAGPVTVNGTLSPGHTNIATLTLEDDVILAGTTRVDLDKTESQTSDEVVGIGNLTSGGTLVVFNNGPALVAGDTFPVFSASTYSGAFASISPATPGAGLAWDTVALPDNGSLIVHLNPVANDDEAGAQHGQTTTIPVAKLLANDDGELGEALSVLAVSANASLSGGVITYTAPLTGTSDVITYTLSDGRGGTDVGAINVALASSGASYNQLSATVLGGGDLQLTYLGIPGTNYALDVTHDLTAPVSWTALMTNAAAGNGYLIFTNTPSQFPTNDFYRTRYVP